MAVANVTRVQDLLGKSLVLTEEVAGFVFERRGVVTGVLTVIPGSRSKDEFLLEQDDGDCCFYSLDEVTLRAIQ
jgi:hypothetical protein